MRIIRRPFCSSVIKFGKKESYQTSGRKRSWYLFIRTRAKIQTLLITGPSPCLTPSTKFLLRCFKPAFPENHIRQTKYGFRANRGTAHPLFILRAAMEWSEMTAILFISFSWTGGKHLILLTTTLCSLHYSGSASLTELLIT